VITDPRMFWLQWVDEAWRDNAACIDVDHNLFFTFERIEDAKAVCFPCPVRDDCLESALRLPRSHDEAGVRGALTAAERQVLRKQRAKEKRLART
jgi:WhiB family transcriptional regulator, redox-sensing transcriptional regulator